MSKTKLISTEIKEVLKDLSNKKKEIKTLENKAGKNVVDVLKDFIRSNEYLDSVKWAQYTPHFNDGETCEFSVHDIDYKFNKEISDLLAVDTLTEDGGWVREWEIDDVIKDRADVLNYKDIQKVEKSIKQAREIHDVLRDMESFLLEEFGDHTEVTVSKKGIETEGYEHD